MRTLFELANPRESPHEATNKRVELCSPRFGMVSRQLRSQIMEALIDQLLAGGHLGLFAAFLVWQHVKNEKRNDNLVSSFQIQLREITEDYDRRIVAMRERYDAVIREARAERDSDARDFLVARQAVHEQIVTKLDRIIEKLSTS